MKEKKQKAEKTENMEKKKVKWLLLIAGEMVVLVVCCVVLYNALKPKVDYESLYRDIDAYTSQLESIVNVDDRGHGVFRITMDSDTWYAGSEHDKMVYCKNVNTNFTYLGQKYHLLSDTQYAAIYYYDEEGINIAEPSDKGYDLESKILH